MSPDVESDVLEKLQVEFDLRPSLKEIIYFAAKDGHAISLNAALSDIEDRRVRNFLVNQEFEDEDGQLLTPLVVAAKNGRFRVVKTLLTCYAPELEATCIVKFDGLLVHGASALWCASASGHLNIVKLLIKHGANVNHRTKKSSTPLRAACFDGRLDIVQYLVSHGSDVNLANVYNNTCLMFSAYRGHTDIVEFLLKSGADTDVQAVCGATALHYAAECGHVDICSMLLDAGAALKKNEYGMSPVITAAERARETVVELFYSRPDLLSKREKIDALELLGATFANDKDNYSVEKAFNYLAMGMALRYEDPHNIIKKTFYSPVPAYDNWIECQTMQELQAIRYNNNSIHMESLTVRERVLGVKCPEVAHPIIYRGAVCADNGRFDRCESLWLRAMQLRQNNGLSVQRDLLRFAQVFSQILHIGGELRVDNVLSVLSSCIVELEHNRDKITNPSTKDDVEVISEEYELNVITALYILTIITKILNKSGENLPPIDLNALYKSIFTLNKLNVKLRDGQTLLHLAVNGVTPVDDFHTSDVCRFPCADTVKLLLYCGALVTEVDCDRNTPLHILTATHILLQLQSSRIFEDDQLLATVEEITKLFLEAGVHLDSVNREGLTAAQLCTSQVIETVIRNHEAHFINLKCLASRCIALHKIPYKGVVPRHLDSYIQLHSSEKL